MLKAFCTAMLLLTRIPVPSRCYITDQDNQKLYSWSVLFYPLVGLLIGLLLWLLQWGLSFISLPQNGMTEAVILLAGWVLVTGALHLDGLADSADAWLGGFGDRERTLEIMKDPRSGPAAVIILVLLLLLKFALLINIDWKLLILAPVAGRTAAMILLATTPNVRRGGMAEALVKHLSLQSVFIVTLIVIALFVLMVGEASLWLFLIFLFGYILRYMMIKRIGGLTGDTVGATVELIEAAVLLVLL